MNVKNRPKDLSIGGKMYNKNFLRFLALFSIFIYCPQVFPSNLDNFTTAFFSALVAPSDGSPCIAVSQSKMPLFQARKEACAKNASFLKEGSNCFMIQQGKDSRNRLAVNDKYCLEGGYFDTFNQLLKDKQVNRSALEGVKRQRPVEIKP